MSEDTLPQLQLHIADEALSDLPRGAHEARPVTKAIHVS